jgi:UDP-N-acetylglucosamine:LPS N-acetylglucosamine transferase
VRELLADPELRARLQTNAKRIGKPHAGRDVIAKVLGE